MKVGVIMAAGANTMEGIDQLNISKKVKDFIIACIHQGVPIEQIGYEFEKTKITDNEKKKKNGQFYTPEQIVAYIIDYLEIDSTMKIVDPACGAGSFLFPIISKLSGIRPLENIYGIDIDQEALDVLQSIVFLLEKEFSQQNLINGNTLVSNEKISSQALDLQTISPKGGFDVVLGNPPYITLKKDIDYDPLDNDFAGIISGQVNAATLMIAKGLSMLKSGGVLAFVLPKNILHVGSYSSLRRFLLHETTILHIVDIRSSFKNVKGEQIILFLKKEIPDKSHEISFKVWYTAKELAPDKTVFVKQRAFYQSNKIYVYEREADYRLIKKISAVGLPLKKVAGEQILRGVSVPASAQFKAGEQFEYIPYIRGRNIQKFQVLPERFVNKKTVSASAKMQKIIGKKIIVQNIFSSESGLICEFDDSGVLTNETVTNIMVDDEDTGHYLLGLLHSKLANYFMLYGCFNCSKMTMHTDREYIGSLPIVFTDDRELYNRIIGFVKLLRAETGNISNLKQELDACFYAIYEMNKNEMEIIQSGLDMFLSKKSRW